MTTLIMNETSKKKHQQQLSSPPEVIIEGNDKKMPPSGKLGLDDTGSSVIYRPSLISKVSKRTLFFIFIPAIPVILLFLCFLLLIDQNVFFHDSTPPPQPSPQMPSKFAPIYRLPTTLFPSLYILTLQVFLPYKPGVDFGPKNQTIAGKVIIHFECHEDTDEIFLNVNDILINDSVKLGDQDSNTAMHVRLEENDPMKQMMKLRSRPMMKRGRNYTLLIHYGTRLRDPLEGGLFLASYENNGEKRYHVVSQMQPIESRRVFPCFDEPTFKAQFQINIIHPTGTTAISNAEAMDVLEHRSNWTETAFDVSPIMSTYLLAIAITDYTFIESKYNNIKLRIWASPNLINDTHFAMDLLPKGLHFYEDYFNIRYPLSKLDIYAVKELRVAAMENWGLITIRENSIAYNPLISGSTEYSKVSMTVLHELAHMWFGNLITMEWWNDLWLNEGFACHMSYKAMKNATPDVDVVSTLLGGDTATNFLFQYQTIQIMSADEKHLSTPLSSNVTINDDIYKAFSKISYHKAAAIIQMVETVVGELEFQKSLQSFVLHHLYENAVSTDFARSIGRTMKRHNSSNPFGKLGVIGSLKTWTRKQGFPQLKMIRVNETAVKIYQEPYNVGGNPNATLDYRYSVPIIYKTSFETNESTTSIINDNETLIVNNLALIDPDAHCYYKINYDDETWFMIAQQLQRDYTSIPTGSRIRLIYEAFSFAISNKLNVTIGFELGKYIKNEKEHGPLQLFTLYMDTYRYIIINDETRELFKRYYLSLLIPIFERVTLIRNEKIDEQVKRLILLKLCDLNYQPCIDYVKKLFSAVMTKCLNSTMSDPNCNSIHTGYRSSVYVMVVKYGRREEFEFLWEKYLIETEMVEKERLLQGLAGTQNPKLMRRVVNYHIANPEIVNQYPTLCTFYYQANTMEPLRAYLMKIFPDLVKKAKGTMLMSNCVIAIYKFPQKEKSIQEVAAFESANKDIIATSGAMGVIRSRQKANAQDLKFNSNFAQLLHRYFNEYVSSSN